ncbi:hypothetical protein NPS01_40300 [Nocardioides psychrotolerans]|uniref:Ig-like domain (Group 1) n=2 Tax=Nocardioides psychrotolerans TaxID=1005945 RepID=A0A1I3IV74_9ACTN|nr:hypothetical protein NPS01_40300 [Nocardioides psychrotolerans]SFI51795.1 Ig-like domain (group 1) [Nocardioides psychrotolerans]
MNSSGIKRGLATTAITALAVTGIPFIATSASATPLATQATAALASADKVDILTVNDVSAKNDGTNTTVSIAATGGSNVTSIQFQYAPTAPAAGDPVNIGGPVARNADGLFVVEWDGNAGAGVTAVDLIAIPNTGLTNTDTEAATLLTNATAQTVELATEGSRGVFQSPYTADTGSQWVAVSGTNSNDAGAVTVSPLFAGAPGGTGATVTPVEGADTTATFLGIVDIKGYPYSPGTESNQLALRAVTGAGSTDDVEASTLYLQSINSITATAASNTVAGTGSTKVTVTVKDQNGNPIPKVIVDYTTPDDDSDVDTNPQPSPGAASLRTNGKGVAEFTLGAGSYTFIAETNAVPDGVANAGEKTAGPVTITSYTPVNTSLVAEPVVAGRADYDIDELDDDNDFRAVIKDQNGNPVAGELVEYSYTFDPAGAAPAGAPSTYAAAAGVTDSNGRITIPFTGSGTDVGTYTLNVRRPAVLGSGFIQGTPFTFDTNESEITFDEAPTASSAVNTSDTYSGKLALLGGLGALGGRTVNVEYTPTGDVVFSTTQPSGTTRVDADSVTAVTKADGTFSVSLTDPPVPANVTPTAETGTLTATAAAPIKDGDDPAGPADSTGALNVVFATSAAPAGSVATIVAITGNKTPGQAVAGTVQLRTAGGAAVPNTQVTLTVDKGFFTDGTNDPAPAVGADAGELKSLTQSITVTTDSAGDASFSVAIERDAGFDDDGLVKAIVTATVGTVTDTEDVDYSSANPLNGGTVELVESPAAEQSGPTDPASVNQSVLFDLVTTDQFGNRVGGEFVNVTENKPGASTTGGFSDFDNSGDISVFSDRAQTVTATATWVTDTYRYTTATGNGAPATVANGETLTDTADVVFEGIDFAASDFSISSNPEGTVVPGTAVTETVTVLDQNGNPAQGLQVEFVRSGAGGGETESRTTNANGEANYTFVASTEGTVNITAIVTDGSGQSETLTDTVTVDNGTQPPVPPIEIVAKLTGVSNGPANDKLKVNAPSSAAGAEVRLFKVIDGRRIQVGKTKGLNSFGNATFIVRDRNGNRLTKYVAVVVKTARTLGDVTNPKRVR